MVEKSIKIRIQKIVLIGCIIFSFLCKANDTSNDALTDDIQMWSTGFSVIDARVNPYRLDDTQFKYAVKKGQIHAQAYPVEVTGLIPPFEPIRKIFDHDFKNPLKKWFQTVFGQLAHINSWTELMTWLGLNPYPLENEQGVYQVQWPEETKPNYLMGMNVRSYSGSVGLTFSCAVCHSSQLFGKTVLGMTNRFPRSNDFFALAKAAMKFLEPHFFKSYTGATFGEMELLRNFQKNISSVGVKKPVMLGLDTSLAQVSLSLSRRNDDRYATKNSYFEKHPRKNELEHIPADSKPAVWWNLKYKNRWLSDGSVVSGNPIYTNFLWNELGRGTDLLELESWLDRNFEVIKEITTMVFASESPKITDFFDERKFDIFSAQRGENLFNEHCANCHGRYLKTWSLPNSQMLSLKEQLQTYKVQYKEKTTVKDVGTDPYRYLGMKSLEKLNDLQISKKYNIVVRAQHGYVPPPLVGIWARWPYMHNNSIPNLCELLTPGNKRRVTYFQGPANDPQTDFDFDCNGYPIKNPPREWTRNSEMKYDTRVKGLGNQGHDEDITVIDGQEIFSLQDKKDLIKFLQTL